MDERSTLTLAIKPGIEISEGSADMTSRTTLGIVIHHICHAFEFRSIGLFNCSSKSSAKDWQSMTCGFWWASSLLDLDLRVFHGQSRIGTSGLDMQGAFNVVAFVGSPNFDRLVGGYFMQKIFAMEKSRLPTSFCPEFHHI